MVDYNSLNDTHKKAAARRAATKYSTDLDWAIRDYMKRTGMMKLVPEPYRNCESSPVIFKELPNLHEKMPDLASACETFESAKDEMLSFLEGYRHPTNNVYAEDMFFFGQVESDIEMQGFKRPTWLQELEKITQIPESILDDIRQYVRNSEVTKIELHTAEDKQSKVQALLDKSHDAYQPICAGERSENRNKRVVHTLGLSTGKRQKSYNPIDVYAAYVKLVRYEGSSRKEATLQVADDFGLGASTVLNTLHEVLPQIRKRSKQQNPSLYKTTVKGFLKNLILDRSTQVW